MLRDQVGTRVVVLGALGDLATRHLLPALAQLQSVGGLGRDAQVVAVDRHELDTAACRGVLAQALARHAGTIPESDREALLRCVEYVPADLSARCRLPEIGASTPVIVYLALPPAVCPDAVRALAAAGLPAGSVVVVEKPWGRDRDSARSLAESLDGLHQVRVVRADHFLYHAVVRDIVEARLAGDDLEARWNCRYIRRVEIVWEELHGVAGRAGSFDALGALRDMVHSHLLRLLAVVAMDLPETLDPLSFAGTRARVLGQVPEPTAAEVDAGTARARYTTGVVGGRPIAAYADEPGVDPARGTETYAHVRLRVESARWRGVPFVLRTGKAVGTPQRHVVMELHPAARRSLRSAGRPAPARVRFPAGGRVCDAERPSVLFLRDLLGGREPLGVGAGEVDEAWRVIDAIGGRWRQGSPPLGEYPAGTTGPVGPR